MKHPNTRTQYLKAMMSLEARRSALQQKLDAIQQQLSDLQSRLRETVPAAVATPPPATGRGKAGSRKRIQRGALTGKILGALAAAGQAGTRVRDLAAEIGVRAANVHSWFQSTAKRHPGVTKLAAGVYRLHPDAGSPAPAPKISAKTRPGRKQSAGGQRGALAARIHAALETAGSVGTSIKEIAGNVGSQYKNISIWFATTGKKNPRIRKIGPARYQLAP